MQFAREWLQCELDMLSFTNTELETFTPLHREQTGNVATYRCLAGLD